jgi:DNA-binding CsgD family transcriptional regulator/tetratricopeptide (TPR) repeat protein
MAWSHDLLDAREQSLFARLGIFAGWFKLEAISEVCADDVNDGVDLLPVFARLVDKSLVISDLCAGRVRYRLLDTVRDYAIDRLNERGEVARFRDRHLDWVLGAAERIDSDLGANQDRALDWAAAFRDDVAAALEWGLTGPSVQRLRAWRLAVAMTQSWFLSGQTHVGLSFLRRALADSDDLREGIRDHLAASVSMLEMISGHRTARQALESAEPPARGATNLDTAIDGRLRARRLLVDTFQSFFSDFARCERLGRETADLEGGADPFSQDFSLIMAAYSFVPRERHTDAVQLARRALERSRSRGDRFCLGFGLGVEQYCAMQTGELVRAIELGRQMVDVIAPLGDYFGVGTLTSNLALAMALHGDTDGARRIMRPIVASIDLAPDVDVVGFQVPLGYLSLFEGRWEDALAWYSRALSRLESSGPEWTAARCLPGAVRAMQQLGRTDDARELLAVGRALTATFDAPQLRADLADLEALFVRDDDPARAFDLHQEALAERRQAGLTTYLPDSLDALVALSAEHEPTEAAARWLSCSSTVREQLHYPRSIPARREHERVGKSLRAALGSAFESAWAEGQAMSLAEAVEQTTRGRGRRGRPKSGWGSLTPTEQEVVRLVATGGTNEFIAERLFVSRATVKSHLNHVYAKLGIVSRTELAARAIAHLPPGGSP